MRAASLRASASSPSGYVSESAVTSTARSPSAPYAARERRYLAVTADALQRGVEVAHLRERADLGLVGEQDVHVVLDEVEERGAMPVDAEGIRERQRDLPPGRVGEAGGHTKRVLGGRRVEEVALQIEDAPAGDEPRIDVAGAELRRRAETGAHRALRVRRHHDEAAAGGRPARRRRRRVAHAGRAKVVAEDLPQLIVTDLAHIVCAAAERGDPDDRVGGGAARDLDGGAHGVIDLARARLVDEMHGSLDEAVEVEERLALVAEDVHERVADADDVDLVSHVPPSSCPAGSTGRSGDRADAASRAGTPRGW